MADDMVSFYDKCAVGIDPKRALLLVAALNPHIGYDKAGFMPTKRTKRTRRAAACARPRWHPATSRANSSMSGWCRATWWVAPPPEAARKLAVWLAKRATPVGDPPALPGAY